MSAQQGSIEWQINRLGCVTASEAGNILLSKAARERDFWQIIEEMQALAQGRAIEYIKDKSVDSFAMRHGRETEPTAAMLYQMEFDPDGFIYSPPFKLSRERVKLGASLDGLVGFAGTAEIKCPVNPVIHAETVYHGMSSMHMAQIQIGLYVWGRAWCDFVSYCRGFKGRPLYVQRVERDDVYLERFFTKYDDFSLQLSQYERSKERFVEWIKQ